MTEYVWAVGQKVVFNSGGRGWSDNRYIVTVERVTPSGRCRIGSDQFDKEGRKRGERSRYSVRSYIVPLTDELRAELVERDRLEAARREWHKLKAQVNKIDDTEALLAIIALAKTFTKEPAA